jgi:DNA polymerase/3'-5' exonuclease PolX
MEDIYGFGPKAAARAASGQESGLRLNWMQRVGVRYHGRWVPNMPRAEAAEVLGHIRQRWEASGLRLRVWLCGSYRRGLATVNDIDLLVQQQEGPRGPVATACTLRDLLRPLRAGGLVPADGDLVRHPLRRYMGFCRLPAAGSPGPFRRLDIHLLGAGEEPAAALLALTGSADFNRGLRERARELGLRLSSRALTWRDPAHPRARRPVSGIRTEQDIFAALGVPFVRPRSR